MSIKRAIVYNNYIEVVGGPTLSYTPTTGNTIHPPLNVNAIVGALRAAKIGKVELLITETLTTITNTLSDKQLPLGPEAEQNLAYQVARYWKSSPDVDPSNLISRHLPIRTGIHIESVRKSDLKGLIKGSIEAVTLFNLHAAYWVQQEAPAPAVAFFSRPQYMLVVVLMHSREIFAIAARHDVEEHDAQQAIRDEIRQHTQAYGLKSPTLVFLNTPVAEIDDYECIQLDILNKPIPEALLLWVRNTKKVPIPHLLPQAAYALSGVGAGALVWAGLQFGVLAPLKTREMQLEQEREMVNLQITRLQATQKRRQQLETLLTQIQQGGPDFPKLFSILGENMPGGVGLSRISLGGGKRNLTIEAEGPEVLIELARRLEKLGMTIKIVSLTRVNQGVYRAEIIIEGWHDKEQD